jgi:hypothetical protein
MAGTYIGNNPNYGSGSQYLNRPPTYGYGYGQTPYLRPPGPYPPMPPPPPTPPFGQTFDPIIGRADEQAAASAAANEQAQGGGQAGGGLNFFGLMNPFANASFGGRQLFPGAAANAPRNAQGYQTNIFGQPYGGSNLPAGMAVPPPLTNESARRSLMTDLANETDPARRARLQAFLQAGQPKAATGRPVGNRNLDYLMSFGRQRGRANMRFDERGNRIIAT